MPHGLSAPGLAPEGHSRLEIRRRLRLPTFPPFEAPLELQSTGLLSVFNGHIADRTRCLRLRTLGDIQFLSPGNGCFRLSSYYYPPASNLHT